MSEEVPEGYCPETIGKSGKRVRVTTAYTDYGCRCDTCRVRKAERNVEQRARYRGEGRCTKCGKEELASDTRCQECLDKAAERYAERYTRRKEEGRCINCGKEELASDTRCRECEFKHYMSDTKYKLRERRERVREQIRERRAVS